MDLKDYATALLMDYKKPDFAAEDPYSPFMGITNQLSKEVQGQAGNPNYSIGDKIAASFITGLLGGGTAGLSEDYQNRAKKAYLAQAIGEATPEQTSLLSPKLFESANEIPSLFAVEKAKQAADLAAKEQMVRLEASYRDPYAVQARDRMEARKRAAATPPIVEQVIEQKDNAKALADLGVGLASIPTDTGKKGILGQNGNIVEVQPITAAVKGVNPAKASESDSISEKRAKLMDLYEGDKSAVNKILEEDRTRPEKLQEMARVEADAARTEISKKPAVASLLAAQTGISRIRSLADIDTSTSDLPFTYAYIQGLDGGIVKEAEGDMIKTTNPLLARLKGTLEGVINGKSGLTVDLKKQMLRELVGTHDSLLEEANRQSATRLKTALKRGVLSPEDVLPFDPSFKYGEKGLGTKKEGPVAPIERLRAISSQLDNPNLSYEMKQQLKAEAQSLVPRPAVSTSGAPIG